MKEVTSVRFDKWLWAVRLYKTRSLAAAACRHGQVLANGQPVKAAREVKVGESIQAKTGEITRTVTVLKLLENRVGASMVKEYAADHTPPSEYEKLKQAHLQPVFYRPKGTGRPTKKERREWNKFEDGMEQ